MFGFIKTMFLTGLTVLSYVNPLSTNQLSATPLSCISVNNQEYKVRPKIINVNSNEPVIYHFSVKTSKYSGSCNNVDDQYAKVRVPDVVRNLNVKALSNVKN